MDVTFTKNQHNIRLDFELDTEDNVVHGNIFINGNQYYLRALSKDIIDLLGEAIDIRRLDNLLKAAFIPCSVNETFAISKARSLEIKLMLIRCIAPDKMNTSDKMKLDAIQSYYKKTRKEDDQHAKVIKNINKWLEAELSR
jgi:hypothetical protein